MSLYRCSVCGSPNVTCESRLSGIKYDYAKGAMGSVILGPGGAAAGITSTTETIYKCADCGAALPYPMADHVKAWIDLGVISLEARKKMEMDFIYWDGLTAQYKNIEKGPADEAIEKAKQLDEANKQSKKQPKKAKVGSIEWEMALDFSSDEGKAYLEKNYKKVEDKIASCEAALRAKEEDNYEKFDWWQAMRRKCSSFSNEMHRKQKQIDELGTINIFNRRKNDTLHNELNCARDEYNKAEELVNIKFKEWNVKPLEDYGPSCINDYDNSFVRRLHAAFSEIKSEKYDIFNTFYEAHNYISIATLALSIFYGLERTRMTGKHLQDAIEYYAYRLITKRNPLFLPQYEALKEKSHKDFENRIYEYSIGDDDDDDDLRFDESDYLSFAASDYSENIGNIIGLKSKYRFTCGRFALFIANDPPTFTNPLIRPSGQLYVYRDDRGITDFGPIESRREKRYGPVHKYCKRRDCLLYTSPSPRDS